jgi:hypothetical protein
MRFVAATLCLLALQSVPALAEPEYMEVQRCIWRCMHNSGGANSPAYQACVQRQCNDAPGKKGKQSSRASWTYGEHPRLGLSAHVEIGEEAFGVACAASDYHPGNSAGASVRITPGLVATATQKRGAVMVYLQPFAVVGGMTFKPNKLGFVENIGIACDTGIKRMQNSKALLFLREKMLSIEPRDGKATLIVEGPSGPTAIMSPADLNPLAEAVRVPLTGAPAAIRKLVQACPALRGQMRQDCSD